MAKVITGIVSSDKRDKTITVVVTSLETHPVYKKRYTRTRKYSAHDEKNEAREGDKVIISECRPFSKTVNFKLDSIIERSKGKIEIKKEEIEVELESEETEGDEK